jgi:DNA polymerase-3 subunit beta
MKFSLNRESLIDVLKKLRPFVSTRSLLPVLQNVRVEAFEDGRVALTVTNLEVIGAAVIGATVDTPGATTLPYTLLASVLSEMMGEQVSFSPDEGERTLIQSDLSESSLAGLPAAEFPKTDFVITNDSFSFPVTAAWLKQRFNQVLFSAAGDDTRPVLCTVLFRVVGGKLTMAATDGFRLTLIDAPEAFGETAVPNFEVIFPAAQMSGILQMLEGDVTVTVNCKRVKFETATATAVLQVPDYDYPDFSPIIPTRVLTMFTLERARAISAARLAMVIAHHNDGPEAITLEHEPVDGEAGWLAMSSAIASVGANEARATLISAEGNQFSTMGVNGGYLLDGLTHAPEGNIQIRTTNPVEPIVIRSVNDATWQCIIMPLHLKR